MLLIICDDGISHEKSQHSTQENEKTSDVHETSKCKHSATVIALPSAPPQLCSPVQLQHTLPSRFGSGLWIASSVSISELSKPHAVCSPFGPIDRSADDLLFDDRNDEETGAVLDTTEGPYGLDVVEVDCSQHNSR